MSLILDNNLSYDDIKTLNNIAKYNDNMQITNNNIYKYMKDTTNNNYLIEDDINLLQTINEENAQIFELKRIFIDAIIGFISDKNIIRCEILNDLFRIKLSIIPQIIYDDIIVPKSDNILVDILQNNFDYANRKIYKLDFININPFQRLIIKVYYDKQNKYENENENYIKQCGFLCRDINMRRILMNMELNLI
jgi:hypothetical protein